MFKEIQVGDTVYFSTPHSKELKGKAVMKGPYGWVINGGGRHGTPRGVHENNFVKMRNGKNRKPDFFGDFHYGV